MPAQRWMRFVYWQMAWMIASVFVLAIFDALSLELFFLLSVLGLVIIADLTEPTVVTPAWRARLRVVLLLGLVGFTIVVVRRVLEIRGVVVVS